MSLKVLALGNRTTTNWVNNSLFSKGADVECFSGLPESSSAIREAKYHLAVIDSYIADLENVCKTSKLRTPLRMR